MKNIVVLAGRSHVGLAQLVVSRLGLPLGKVRSPGGSLCEKENG